MSFWSKVMSVLDPIHYSWDDDSDNSGINTDAYNRTSYGAKIAEAAEAPSYGNPSTYTPANFNYGNPSTYTPSNPTPIYEEEDYSEPYYEPEPNYVAPAVSEAVPSAPTVPNVEIDSNWANDLSNLVARYNMLIANAKNEYDLAMKHGNELGMARANQKAEDARKQAIASGVFAQLNPLLQSAGTASYADYIRALEKEEQERMNQMRNANRPGIRDYAGYDSKSSDTSRNRYGSNVNRHRMEKG